MRGVLCFTAAVGLCLVQFAAGRAQEKDDARAVIDQAIKAHGGAGQIGKFKASVVKAKGKVAVMGQNVVFTMTNQALLPGRMRLDMEMEVAGQKFTFAQGLDGDKGWMAVNGKAKDLDKDQLAESKAQMYVHEVETLYPLAGKEYKLSPLGTIKVGGKNAVGVLVTRKDRRDVNLFFDKATGLLVRSKYRTKDVLGGAEEEYTATNDYSGYKEAQGVKYPTKIATLKDGKPYVETEVTEYTPYEKLDLDLFKKPE
jgi:hypothetical protein